MVQDASTSPWREPVRGGYPDPSLFALSGLEQLRALIDGRMPRPPVQVLTGLRLIDAAPGSAVFEMPLSPWLCSPQGAIAVGPLTIPADAALGCAVQAALEAATPFTTSELSLRLLAPARPGETAIARATIVHAGRTLALSEGTVTDSHGRLLAHGSSLCVMTERPRAAADGTPTSATPANDAPEPWTHPAAGETVPQATWDSCSGFEVLGALLAGELPAPPISHLTGLRLAGVAEGSATFTMPASEWLSAPPRGRAQGGTVALLADAALSAAIQTATPAGTALAPVDLKVNYLRPLATDGREATAVGRLLHAGRRIAVASAEVRDADEKPVALATGSAMLLPGRPASLTASPTS